MHKKGKSLLLFTQQLLNFVLIIVFSFLYSSNSHAIQYSSHLYSLSKRASGKINYIATHVSFGDECTTKSNMINRLADSITGKMDSNIDLLFTGQQYLSYVTIRDEEDKIKKINASFESSQCEATIIALTTPEVRSSMYLNTLFFDTITDTNILNPNEIIVSDQFIYSCFDSYKDDNLSDVIGSVIQLECANIRKNFVIKNVFIVSKKSKNFNSNFNGHLFFENYLQNTIIVGSGADDYFSLSTPSFEVACTIDDTNLRSLIYYYQQFKLKHASFEFFESDLWRKDLSTKYLENESLNQNSNSVFSLVFLSLCILLILVFSISSFLVSANKAINSHHLKTLFFIEFIISTILLFFINIIQLYFTSKIALLTLFSGFSTFVLVSCSVILLASYFIPKTLNWKKGDNYAVIEI